MIKFTPLTTIQITFLITSLLPSLSLLVAPTCLDERQDVVDSWVSFTQNNDYQYYFHNNTLGFVKSSYRLDQTTDGAIMGTVNQLYEKELNMSNIGYVLYNVSN